MSALSRSFLDLSRRCGRHPVLLRRGSSKIPPIDDQKIRRVEEKSAEESKKEKNKNTQEDNKANIRVCIIGGGVTPFYTAVLLKQYGIIKSIRLVDTWRGSMSEILADVSHLETSPCIDYFRKKDMKQALSEVRVLGNTDLTENFLMDLSK